MDSYEKSKRKTKRYKKIKALLKSVYGYDSFRSKQYEIINRIICGEDVCAILATGIGKSLTFQIPALYIDRPAVIISPLISLMADQRMILEELGISSCCYNSEAEDKSRMRKDILKGKYKFIYITPESVVHMKDFLINLEDIQGISLIAIDEAHCISSYGFDFRKAYRELTFFKEALPNIPILALTATATNLVGKDICKVLGLKTSRPLKSSFDRPNLYIEVRRKSKKIDMDIVPIIKKYNDKSIIIYCLTKKETASVAEILKMHKINCGIYHAGLDSDEKADAHKNFIKGKVKVIAATIAFGMGINKSDVRVVIHYGAPKNIEGYYQEIGRAGRDGKKAYCFAFYNARDFKIQESFISNIKDQTYQKVQLGMLEKMKNYMSTNLCRRQMILEYFGDEADDKCDFCDNCCGVHKDSGQENIKTEQDVQSEAKLLIDLVESTKKNFGLGMYINILRGSKNKNITSQMRKNKFYSKGSHRSAAWWKEVSENLVKLGYLRQRYVQGGRFAMQVVDATQKGIQWANMAELNDFMDGLSLAKLEPMKMTTTV